MDNQETAQQGTDESQPTLLKARRPLIEYLQGLDASTPIGEALPALIEMSTSQKGKGGGGRVAIIREVRTSDGTLFALRCRATGILLRMTDTNGEATFKEAKRSANGYSHNCIAVNAAKEESERLFEEARKKAEATAMKKDWTLKQFNERVEELREKFTDVEVTVPDTYVQYETAEEAQAEADQA